MKHKRLNILKKLEASIISLNEAEDKLNDLFEATIISSLEGIEKKCDRDQKEAFKDNMDFDRFSFKEGASYVIGRLKKQWRKL